MQHAKLIKHKPLVLTENGVEADDEEWRPISSPLKVTVPMKNSTKFHFVSFDQYPYW